MGPAVERTQCSILNEMNGQSCCRYRWWNVCRKSIELAVSLVGAYTHKNKRLIREQLCNQKWNCTKWNHSKRSSSSSSFAQCVPVHPTRYRLKCIISIRFDLLCFYSLLFTDIFISLIRFILYLYPYIRCSCSSNDNVKKFCNLRISFVIRT